MNYTNAAALPNYAGQIAHNNPTPFYNGSTPLTQSGAPIEMTLEGALGDLREVIDNAGELCMSARSLAERLRGAIPEPLVGKGIAVDSPSSLVYRLRDMTIQLRAIVREAAEHTRNAHNALG